MTMHELRPELAEEREPMTKLKWYVDTKNIHEIVVATDQFEAMDTLRDAPANDFGLIVTAQRVDKTEEDGSYACRTSLLMGKRWGRVWDAKLFVEAGIAQGMGDMSATDLP